ncbi:MAG: hypothetical protein SVR81_11225 [Chloroflexota bacterium]|nr:hypothetical protein [Chloroflexota bacterium]
MMVIKDSKGEAVNPDAIRSRKPGSIDPFTVFWPMPEAADNSYQGTIGQLGIIVSAEQIAD